MIMWVPLGLGVAVLLFIVITANHDAAHADKRAKKEAVLREAVRVGEQVIQNRPTRVWLTMYAKTHRDAEMARDEARTMLYGTVQKARREGLSIKEIASLSGLSETTIRRIAPAQAQVNGEVPS